MQNVTIIDTTIKEMFDNCFSSFHEMVYETKDSSVFSSVIDALISEDMILIRELFTSGMSANLVSEEKMKTIDSCDGQANVMIRIFKDNGVLLGCVVNDEIQY